MAFGRSGVLAVELGSGQLRLIHGTVSGQRLRVFDFAAEGLLTEASESAADQLSGLVERRQLRSSSAAVALSGPGVVHRVLNFPPMPMKELQIVVEREMKTMGEAGGTDVVFDWEVIQETELESVKQIQVLVAIAHRGQVEEARHILRGCGLKPTLITTAPVSLLRSLKLFTGQERGMHVILYIGGQQGYLLGVRNGAWSFYREFSSRISEQAGEPPLEEALREANRALLYHRQRYREEEEVSFLLAGDKGLEDLQIRLKWEMGIEGRIVQPSAVLDLEPLEERSVTFIELFPSFIISLGLVAAYYSQSGVNLISKTERRWVSMRPNLPVSINWSYAYRPASLAVLALCLLGVHLYLVRTEQQYERLLKGRSDLYARWRPAIQAAEESRDLHESQKLLEQSLGSARITHLGWVPLFKVISRLAAPDLLLYSMNLRRDQGKWTITLKGEVVSHDIFTAQTAFNRFYQGLKRSSYVEGVELLPLSVSVIREREEAPGTAQNIREEAESSESNQTGGEGREIKKTKVQFEIRAQAKET